MAATEVSSADVGAATTKASPMEAAAMKATATKATAATIWPPPPPPPLAYAATDRTIAQARTAAHAVNFDLNFNIEVVPHATKVPSSAPQPEPVISIQQK
jgi:hypothetical protein